MFSSTETDMNDYVLEEATRGLNPKEFLLRVVDFLRRQKDDALFFWSDDFRAKHRHGTGPDMQGSILGFAVILLTGRWGEVPPRVANQLGERLGISPFHLGALECPLSISPAIRQMFRMRHAIAVLERYIQRGAVRDQDWLEVLVLDLTTVRMDVLKDSFPVEPKRYCVLVDGSGSVSNAKRAWFPSFNEAAANAENMARKNGESGKYSDRLLIVERVGRVQYTEPMIEVVKEK